MTIRERARRAPISRWIVPVRTSMLAYLASYFKSHIAPPFPNNGLHT
jgi:hypothetical protein